MSEAGRRKNMGEALRVVSRFYELTDKKETKGLKDLIAEDMSFVGPVMQTTGATQYIAMNEQLLPFHVKTRMVRQFERDNDVCSIYEMDLKTPSGGAITLQLADWIRVAKGKIVEQRIYYDPRDFEKAFGRT